MKTILHTSDSRGLADHDWLTSRHTFSFANYFNPERMSFGVLRVLNDDIVQPGMGFGTHPHDNMEIISIPLSGTLAHKDSMGHTQTISPGEVQVMSAGTGITHSEFNHSNIEAVNFLQIWIIPNKKNVKPRYNQKEFNFSKSQNTLIELISPEHKEEGLWIHQNAWFNMGVFDNPEKVTYTLNDPANGLYIFVIEGGVKVNGKVLQKRDAIGIENTEIVEFYTMPDTMVLLMEIPMNFE